MEYNRVNEQAFFEWIRAYTAADTQFMAVQNIREGEVVTRKDFYERALDGTQGRRLGYIDYHPTDQNLHSYYLLSL